MNFTDEEKLMLFLIWCIGERGLSIDFHDGFGDKEINLWITSHGAFLQFLSEATQAKESYEFWINSSDYGRIVCREQSVPLLRLQESIQAKHKITITIN